MYLKSTQCELSNGVSYNSEIQFISEVKIITLFSKKIVIYEYLQMQKCQKPGKKLFFLIL